MLFFFQAEDGIRDFHVTGVQTCALPISDTEEPPGLRRGFEVGGVPGRHPSSGAGGVPPGLSYVGPQRDLAMLTVSWRPPTSRPSRASMARRASFDEAISTKPKPRERPVSRSVTTCALVTWPCSANRRSSWDESVSNVRFPT